MSIHKHLYSYHIYLVSMLLLILFLSCEKEAEWTATESDQDIVIVEGVLTNEYKYQEVILSYAKSSPKEITRFISHAVINVSDEQADLVFAESDSLRGHYFSTIPFSASISKMYHLNIEFDDNIYTASSGMQAVSPMQKLQYGRDGDSDFYKITSVAPMYDPNEQALYEVVIWGDSIISSVDTVNLAKVFYYTFNTIDVGEVFAPDKDQILFKKGAWIIERKYSLTADYADFVRAMASETQWQGSFFSETPANVPTNIKGGAFGFFTACTVLTDSIKVE